MKFDNSFGDSYLSFLVLFGAYFTLKSLASMFAYYEVVIHRDIWRAQQVWFTFGFPSLMGMMQSFSTRLQSWLIKEHVEAKWVTTASNARRNAMEWFNGIYLFVLVGAMIVSIFTVLRANETCFEFLAASLFGGAIAIMLWPGVSMTIYEMAPCLHSVYTSRVEIPTHLVYAGLVVLGLVISQVAVSDITICHLARASLDQ